MFTTKGLFRRPRPTAPPLLAEATAPERPSAPPPATTSTSIEAVDPPFEGGGGVLMSPAFWEKAGWGIALLTALIAGA